MTPPYINDIQISRLLDFPMIHQAAEVRMVEKKEQKFLFWVAEGLSTPLTTNFIPILSSNTSIEGPISHHQPLILTYANQIFEGSRTLSEFEEVVLSQTFKRLTKREPTKPNRR